MKLGLPPLLGIARRVASGGRLAQRKTDLRSVEVPCVVVPAGLMQELLETVNAHDAHAKNMGAENTAAGGTEAGGCPGEAPRAPDLAAMLPLAIELAANAHGATMNKDGTPYILHPLRLMTAAQGYEDKIVAVLHDTLEDTRLTPEFLRAAGFPPVILNALDSLTKRPGEADAGDVGYADFIRRCASDPIALRVKLLDLYDNIDVTRLPHLGEWELARTAKYHRAINFLRGWHGELPLGC